MDYVTFSIFAGIDMDFEFPYPQIRICRMEIRNHFAPPTKVI